ncbi:site-specific integrase [Sedimenticola hydrogenitrophicus]|uniref:site-specific integrase n=1 Tax=Sedimenticola hydrogenitrophicus TaxID=2967975 RepID=UPI0023B0351E|nr:site-specific integrase [Sedimenticola hydrogenitrophicus]
METRHATNDLEQAYRAALIAGIAQSSRRAYERDVRYFWNWAQEKLGLEPVYPVAVDTLLHFILDHRRAAGGKHLKITTLRRYLSSLSIAHAEHSCPSPTRDERVKLLLRRLRQAEAGEPPEKKSAITADLLNRLVDTCDESLRGIRDRAILLVGFASGGRRRSELASLQVTDLQRADGGYLLRIRTNKTDQQGKGHLVPVLGPAAAALSRWLMAAGIRDGAIFRSIKPDGRLCQNICGRTINRLVKTHSQLAGLDPALYGAHSLRSGYLTEAGKAGTQPWQAMALSLHRSEKVALGYYQQGAILQNPAAHLLAGENQEPI